MKGLMPRAHRFHSRITLGAAAPLSISRRLPAQTGPARLVVSGLALLACLALGGCSLPAYPPTPAAKAPAPKPYAGAQSRFAKPAIANGQRLVLVESQVRGHRIQVTDEDGPFWVNLSHNHDVTAGVANQVKVTDGRWWIDPSGLLCLKSSAWWKDGTCFELFGGHQFAEASVIHSLNRDSGPNTYYPFAVTGPVN
ncbi:MAG TPA: hypothetical protein VND94_07615 [Terriglobia bacterium]|nr:hypothetical protein [Terriglobia bacterium]